MTHEDEPTQYQVTILSALQGKLMYLGTVPTDTIIKRRVKNKMARISRRRNRRG